MKDFTILKREMTGWNFQLFFVCVSLVPVVEGFLVPDTTGLDSWKHVEKWTPMHSKKYYPCEMF